MEVFLLKLSSLPSDHKKAKMIIFCIQQFSWLQSVSGENNTATS